MAGDDLPFLAVDIGAGRGRVSLGFFSGTGLKIEEIHRFGNMPVPLNGILYWDFLYLWGQIIEGMQKCSGKGFTELSGIAVDTWNADFGLVSANGTLMLNPVSYRDRSTEAVVDEIREIVPNEELFRLTGSGLLSISALARLYWMDHRFCPGILEKADTYLPLPDLFRFYLCGGRQGEETVLWGSQLFHVEERKWCTGLRDRLGFPADLFPETVGPGTVTGTLTPRMEEITKISALSPVIAVAGHDTMSAAVCAPRGGNKAFLCTGSWSIFGVHLEHPVTDRKALQAGFMNEIGADSIIFAKNLMGFYILESLIRGWTIRGRDCSYANLLSLAEKAESFTLRIDVNDPFLFSSVNMESSLRTYLEEGGQHYPRSMGPVVRSILEGIALSYRATAEEIERYTGGHIEEIRVLGGGVRNELFCGMIAHATGRRVVTGPAEAATAGNLCMQASATGRLSNIQDFDSLNISGVLKKEFAPSKTADWECEYKRRLQMKIQPKKI